MKIITTKRKFLIGAIFVLLSILGRDNLMAQTVTITGKITSEQDGLGVSGASVSLKGTTKGTYSNDNGHLWRRNTCKLQTGDNSL